MGIVMHLLLLASLMQETNWVEPTCTFEVWLLIRLTRISFKCAAGKLWPVVVLDISWLPNALSSVNHFVRSLHNLVAWHTDCVVQEVTSRFSKGQEIRETDSSLVTISLCVLEPWEEPGSSGEGSSFPFVLYLNYRSSRMKWTSDLVYFFCIISMILKSSFQWIFTTFVSSVLFVSFPGYLDGTQPNRVSPSSK